MPRVKISMYICPNKTKIAEDKINQYQLSLWMRHLGDRERFANIHSGILSHGAWIAYAKIDPIFKKRVVDLCALIWRDI